MDQKKVLTVWMKGGEGATTKLANLDARRVGNERT